MDPFVSFFSPRGIRLFWCLTVAVHMYRFFLNSLTGADVPLLYSPVPFQNASLSIPQVGEIKYNPHQL